MDSILTIVFGVIGIIFSFITYKASKNFSESADNLAKLGNEISEEAKDISNYTADVRISSIKFKAINVNSKNQNFKINSSKKTIYTTTLNLAINFEHKYGKIEWEGVLFPDLSTNNFSVNNIHSFDFSKEDTGSLDITVFSNKPNNGYIFSHGYLCTIDSNNNLSINLIELIVKPIGTNNGLSTTFNLNANKNRFSEVDCYYRCFSNYELISYSENNKKFSKNNASEESDIWDILKVSTNNHKLFISENFTNIQKEISEIKNYINSIK